LLEIFRAVGARFIKHRWPRHRQRGQGLVEAAYTAVLLVVVLGLILDIALWGHAQNVATVAVQDGARVAAAQDGDLARGRARAQNLLAAGLGASSALVTLAAYDDGQSVRLVAIGEWSLISGPSVDVGLPIAAESRMLKHAWHP
jgi:Flp pilus assembly protein TadG